MGGVSVEAFLTLTELVAGESRIITLTVLFLALRFSTVAGLPGGSLHWLKCKTMSNLRLLSCPQYVLNLVWLIAAVIATTLFGTHLSRIKTFAVHF